MSRYIKRLIFLAVGLSLILVPAVAYASLTPTLNQTINAGTLSANFLQTDDSTAIASPSVPFPAQNYSFQCKTSAATLADGINGNTGYLNVTNLANGINTWNIAIAATSGPTATWTNGTQTYKFNDATGTGCTNGQLTVDPSTSTATLTDDCNSTCNNTGVTQGSATAFNHAGSVDSVTLLSDSNGTAWEGYLTGIGLSQKIPSLQHSGSYTLGMTVTLSNT
jgi:hypothetical protein